jgi:hypothetical protein
MASAYLVNVWWFSRSAALAHLFHDIHAWVEMTEREATSWLMRAQTRGPPLRAPMLLIS